MLWHLIDLDQDSTQSQGDSRGALLLALGHHLIPFKFGLRQGGQSSLSAQSFLQGTFSDLHDRSTCLAGSRPN